MKSLKSFNRINRFYSKFNGSTIVPTIKNEHYNQYAPGSEELKRLQAFTSKFQSENYEPVDIPVVVNGKRYYFDDPETVCFPWDNKRPMMRVHRAPPQLIKEAIKGSLKAKEQYEKMSLRDRSAIFLKAADMASTSWREKLVGTTMVGQGKTAWQAEIDSAAELIDFLRFNAKFATSIYDHQPPENFPYTWNSTDYRPLEGFVASIAPFNFTAIQANLVASPLLMGNVVLNKPSDTAALSGYTVYELFEEAGVPPGTFQWLPSEPLDFSNTTFRNKLFAGLHFTGSTETFIHLQKKIMGRIRSYRSYPRVVGETGGKNMHFVHSSANVTNVINQTLRGAFEFSGQKCSATSRMYVPESLWPEIKEGLIEGAQQLKVGSPLEPSSFLSCVIDEKSFKKLSGYIDRAKMDDDVELLAGGTYDSSQGWYIQPTIFQTKNPKSETMREELFGPVLTIYVYPDNKFAQTLRLADNTSPYGLTASIFAKDRVAINQAMDALRFAAGNFYINDKSTGAVVGNQAFGGGRKSGTNDKAGDEANLHRWVQTRTIKENFVDLESFHYPSTKPQ